LGEVEEAASEGDEERKGKNMTQNEPIEIVPAGNGFIVRPKIQDMHVVISSDSNLVFQSYRALAVWLGEHFTHRDKNVESD
jgi:hypothetical protein